MQSPYAAYLRVYEPLAAFDDERADFWRAYVASGAAVSTGDGPRLQRELFYRTIGVGWDRLPPVPEHAYVIEGRTGPLVCPWQSRHRIAAAVRGLPGQVPSRLISAFAPASLIAEAGDWGAGPDTRGELDDEPVWHEHVAIWHVPTRWFACVEEAERELDADGRPGLRYRVSMARARRRTNRAYGILRTSLGKGNPVAVSMRHLSEWLSVFHPRAVVELDYGGLAEALGRSRLHADDSPRLVLDGLQALTRGDVTAAGRSYEELVRRWRRIRLGERGN